MAKLFLHISLVLCMMTFPGLTHLVHAQRLPPARYATPGGSATGEIIQENRDQLQLNVTPCGAGKVVLIFRKPYTKDAAGTIQCEGVTKKVVQAIQR
jgi:hypothetical protein